MTFEANSGRKWEDKSAQQLHHRIWWDSAKALSDSVHNSDHKYVLCSQNLCTFLVRQHHL